MSNASLSLAWAPRAWGFVLDIVYPPRCGGCDRRGTLLCDDCLMEIAPAKSGYDVEGIEALMCGGAFGGRLRTAIHRLKYQSDGPLAKPLAMLMSEALARDARWVADDGEPPLLLPVPLHPSKKRMRGYNQSELLARELAKITGWKVEQRLARVKVTRSQVGLDAEERVENVRDAFEWPGEAAPARVMLVDDVCTTGATLSACASALMLKGTEHVFAAAAARAASLQDVDF